MPSARDAHARSILEAHHLAIGEDHIPDVRVPNRSPNDVITIGIVGAGISGLYVALMLDYLNDPRFTYEILEANPDEARVGGRLYTHHFKGGKADDYYVGRTQTIPGTILTSL